MGAARDMLHIHAIGVGVVPACQSIEDAAPSLGLTSTETRMFKRLFGLVNFPYDEAMALQSLLLLALKDLAHRSGRALEDVTHVFHCHTVPCVVPFGQPFAGGAMAFDSECASLAMSHCATGITALSLAGDMLLPGETALILIGEKAYHPNIRLIADTTIMGEAAVALLVGFGKTGLEVLGTRSDHDGRWAINRGYPGEDSSFDRDYVEFLESHISAALNQFSLSANDLDLILPHNVNTISWVALARRLGFPLGKLFLQNIGTYGHCFGVDPFINAVDAIACNKATPGSLALMVSVGMGLTAASALVRIPSNDLWRTKS
nr:3-oxoacyl-[acyl-carrier-protein] synthase III C-terminal domain-containing protein [uncultured Gellertiella sp.]